MHAVTAFDPTTGAQLWTYTGDSHSGATLVDASSDGGLYAVSSGTPASVPYLVRLDPATGHSTPAQPTAEVSALNNTTSVVAYR